MSFDIDVPDALAGLAAAAALAYLTFHSNINF
jgi:hypothetical protein